MLRRHAPEFRQAKRLTDLCKHCLLLRQKVVPTWERAAEGARAELQALLPSYWNDLDQRPEWLEVSDKPLGRAKMLARYVSSHKDAQRGSRGGKLSQFRLHECEAKILHALRPKLDVLAAYCWHAAAAERQKRAAQKVLADAFSGARAGAVVLWIDFAQNLNLPWSAQQTREEFHTQASKEASCLGVRFVAEGP